MERRWPIRPVAFDAMQAARGRGVDVLLIDTAGRLHTKVNLMEELKKVKRVVERGPRGAQGVLLVLDATTGQNGVQQAQFTEAVDVSGVILTKLDGQRRGYRPRRAAGAGHSGEAGRRVQ